MTRWMRGLGVVMSGLLQAVLFLIGITLITFFILHLSPKNPAQIWLVGNDGNVGQVSEETLHAQEAAMGLDKPVIIQYRDWLVRLLHGDMGTSFTTGKPVASELLKSLGPTAVLAFVSLTGTLIISIPLGIYCACRKDRLPDQLTRIFSFIGISLPSFLVSLLLLWLFCLKLKALPVLAHDDPKGMILPAAVLTLQCSARLTRQIRGVVLTELQKDYILGAMARGASGAQILFGHVLKNIMAPLMTWISMYFGVLVGGAAIVETIFSLDGLGRLAVEAVTRMDYYMIQGFILVTAVIFLALNFIVDVISRCMDHTGRYEW